MPYTKTDRSRQRKLCRNNDEPNDRKSSIDKEEPEQVIPKTGGLESNHARPRTGEMLPRLTHSDTDSNESKQHIP